MIIYLNMLLFDKMLLLKINILFVHIIESYALDFKLSIIDIHQ